MKDNKEGIVVEINNNIAKVKLGKHSDCESCGACPGSQNVFIDAENKVSAKVGQRVFLEIKEVSMVKASFFTFILPLISIVIILIGISNINSKVDLYIKVLTIGGGILLFLSSILYIKFLDKKLKETMPAVTMIHED